MITNFPNGISSFGIPITGISGGRTSGGSVFGTTYFVDPSNGDDGFPGTSADSPLKTLTQAFSLIGSNDTILCAPGDYTGNYQTPLNSVAPFVSLIGVQATDGGFGPFGSGTAGSPFLEVRARGWRISGFEFDGVSDDASVKLTASGTSNANFCQIDNCLFTGGKYGIDWSGAPTYTKVYSNKFEDILTSAFTCTDSSGDTPQRCDIFDNRFVECAKCIDMGSGGGARGFKNSTIRSNYFMLDGIARDATILLDNRGGGSSAILDNYFDVTKTQYGDDSSTAFVRTTASDFGAGNHCNDGDPTAKISD